MINTEWIKCEEQKYFKMGYDAGVLETQLDNARKAPAQTEQVPAVFYRCMNCKHAYEDKPVTSCDCMAISYFERIEYYTSPPEHEWVGLTDMERLACQSFSHAQTVINTEAKLKELNHDNKTEALKLALEALEELNDTEQTYAAIDRGYAAISAIKEALAQPEQEPNQETITIQEAWEACGGNPGIQATKSELVTTLKMLDEVCDEAQSKQEPVAYVVYPCTFFKGSSRNPELTFTKPELSSEDLIVNLYTSPPQRKPMTDEEIQDALEAEFLGSDEKRNWQDDLRVARAIEAAHGMLHIKEKNHD